ncbi:hydroxyacylglutathione hydrolase [Roseobacter cerasinus]|uniref:Hydroxyacylglutathione hydrolase n=1 Tax=Roseobacter cerasinus TaxID=2602289 RepID=A0A640VVJ3_9RHOB|nr:hydroxyacylglutathione hydrolase [Roseobacter cerasinus]GFE52183.1 hydroxyacylglutathione hydrolase [Roseobacter cerasinus]
MALELVTVPCLSDNYAFLLQDDASGATAVVDVPEAAPILETASARGWTITEVWITHHHADHTQGLADVLAEHKAVVRGGAADAHKLPPLDHTYSGEDLFDFAGHEVRVIDVPGHTTGHIAFYVADAAAVFTADSLMALGCGRLFEGTAEQMWGSLTRLMALPAETTVCSGHEYTASNAKFALTIDPDNPKLISRSVAINAARAAGEATVPSTLALEMDTNPFLRASNPDIRAHLGMTDAADVQVFAEIRARKDAF